jgi:hypothetical protein
LSFHFLRPLSDALASRPPDVPEPTFNDSTPAKTHQVPLTAALTANDRDAQLDWRVWGVGLLLSQLPLLPPGIPQDQLRCAWGRRMAQDRAIFEMKNETKKTTEAQLLDLLKKVLPQATRDAQLAGKIYQAIELELKAKARGLAFEKFCAKVELSNLKPKSLAEIKTQLAASFGQGDVTLKPNRKDKRVAVEVSLIDGTQFSGEIKVNPDLKAAASEEQEITLKFVPFPVCLPGDKELVWLLGKRENLSPEEAGIALTKAETEFWGIEDRPKAMARSCGAQLSGVHCTSTRWDVERTGLETTLQDPGTDQAAASAKKELANRAPAFP